MRKLSILLLLMVSLIGLADDRQHSMQLAQKAYEEGKYLEAIKNYESIASQGYQSFELFYNLGNAYFKANSTSQALLNYERAKRLNPTDEDLLFNLELANSFLVDKFEKLPELGISSWFKNFVLSLSTNLWGFLSLVLFIGFLACILLYFFKAEAKKISLILIPVFLLLSITTYTLGTKAKKYTTVHDSGIIFTPSLTVKSVPGNVGSDLFVIHSGLKVQILDTQNEWFKIKLPDGNIGWIKKSDVEII